MKRTAGIVIMRATTLTPYAETTTMTQGSSQPVAGLILHHARQRSGGR